MDERHVEEELQGAPQTGARPEDPNVADRIIATVTAPRQAFNGLLRAQNLNGVIGIGAVILILLSVGSSVLVSTSGIAKEKQAEELERLERLGESSEEELERMRVWTEMEPSETIIASTIGMIIFIPILLLLLGLIVLAVSKVFERGHETYIRYRHGLAVATLSLIPPFATYFLLALVQLLANVDVSVLGLHALVSPTQTVPYMALSTFSLPNIIWFVIAGIGTAGIAGSSEKGPIITYGAIALVIMIIFGLIGTLVPELAPV